MAVVTRYFSTTSAGAGNGTTWADRAALLSSGNWSTVITGFDFSGSDSLRCLIEGAITYTPTQALENAIFTVASPTVNNNLILCGCDSSGNQLSPPDPGWVSSQSPFSASTFPTLATTTNIAHVNQLFTELRCLRLTASGRLLNLFAAANADWCAIEQNTSASGATVSGTSVSNSYAIFGGDAFSSFMTAAGNLPRLNNVRIDGTAGTSSGNRVGILAPAAGSIIQRVTVINCAGGGIRCTGGTNTTRFSDVLRCLVIGCGNYGIKANETASQTVFHTLIGNVVVACDYNIDGSTNGRLILGNNRLRNPVSSNYLNIANADTSSDNVTTGTNADEFVDAAGGDYRIKNTSDLWGKGFGPGDEPAAAGGGGGFYVSQSARMLR
jgi:hypothetical protein